jgi:nicotinate-nucleotide pyrophosphorylase
MHEYDEEVLKTFLRNQGKLFEEPVAETIEEAETFLEDCMAVVVNSLDEVREYFDESGADIMGLDLMDLEEESEVFKIADGRYLIVEA